MRKRSMSLIVISVLAVMLCSGAAVAYETGIYEQGVLVPYASYNMSGQDTVVGLVLDSNPGASSIYWSFMSANGVQLSFGSIPVTSGFFTFPFSLASNDGGVNAGADGWLLFTWDNNGTLEPGEDVNILSANAFLLDLTANDAAFIPTIPLDGSDYNTPVQLNNVQSDVLVSMVYGVNPGSGLLSVRFTNDSSIQGTSELYIFTPLNAPAQFDAFADGDSGVESPDFFLNSVGTRVNVFDLSIVTDLNVIANGIINIDNPGASPIGFAFVLSSSSVLGATQTTTVNADR